MGSFTVELYANHSPRTCTNFIELSRRGYYDNVKFHRIIKDFIVQGGNPTGTGRGGQSIYEGFLGKFGDEIHLELKHTGAGILSMANACPNTNGSQFFITLAPCPSLESIMPQPEMSYDPLSSHRLFTESPSGLLNSLSRHGRSSDGLRSFVPGSPSQAGISRSLMNLDSFNRYNMDGIAEQVLSSLERINFHDHHRDMRLDIDNMSYEELLALEERMGTVSTALTDEALSKCLETSVYQLVPQEHLAIDSDESKDDVKCSICQEEYAVGDEVGRLRCDHKYHTVCVNQWLRLKNWCPICKSPAEPSPPLSNV